MPTKLGLAITKKLNTSKTGAALAEDRHLEVRMTYKKDTDGTHVYAQCDKKGEVLTAGTGAKIPTLYIRKSALPTTPPKTITITVNW